MKTKNPFFLIKKIQTSFYKSCDKTEVRSKKGWTLKNFFEWYTWMEKNWRWAEQSGTRGKALLCDFTQAHAPSLGQICKVWPGWAYKLQVLINFYSLKLAPSLPAAWWAAPVTPPSSPDIVWASGPFTSTALAGPAAPHFLCILLCLLTAPIHGSLPQPQTCLHLLVKFLCSKLCPGRQTRAN